MIKILVALMSVLLLSSPVFAHHCCRPKCKSKTRTCTVQSVATCQAPAPVPSPAPAPVAPPAEATIQEKATVKEKHKTHVEHKHRGETIVEPAK